jgi:tRNA-splicing ligase RtcB
MDLARLERIDDWTWTVPRAAGETRAEVRLYGARELLASMDDKVLEQIGNVARLPGLVGFAATMPDAHWGYGFPIGGVAAFDPEEGGIISAGGVGFDISCGIRCLRAGLGVAELEGGARELAAALFAAIPAGIGEEGELKLSERQLDETLAGGARWAIERGYGEARDLEYVEERGRMA